MNTIILNIKDIVPDENQPRRYFAAEKIATLKASIEKYGIMTPLTVEKIPTGGYLIVDGERRFRAAKLVGLEDVPVIIQENQDLIERLIKQFNIQEQHEAWTGIEKAEAIDILARSLEMSHLEVCRILHIPSATQKRYAAFAQLADKESFKRHEINMDWAHRILSLRKRVGRILELKGEEFPKSEQKELEEAITSRISNGSLEDRSDLSKLGDSFQADPSSIRKFVKNPTESARTLFKKSGAQIFSSMRNASANSRYLEDNLAKLLASDVEPEPAFIVTLKRIHDKTAKYIARYS